jgi:hypothetical protein
MEKLMEQELANEIVKRFFHFYLSRWDKTGRARTYEDYEIMAKEFLATLDNDSKNINSLLSANVQLSDEAVRFSENLPPIQKLLFQIGWKNFYTVLRNVVTGIKPEENEYQGFVRRASPPLAAYDYVGNNDLDITKSDRSYSLLFE